LFILLKNLKKYKILKYKKSNFKKSRNHMTNLEKLKELCSNLTILYVEDEMIIKEMMVQYLQKFFLKVETASDGREGLEKFQKGSYDIVISDLSMPRMSGALMLKEIQNIKKNQLVLVTSAYTLDDPIFDLSALNIFGYINKPFDLQQLNTELYNAVSNFK